jgi:hypothetical protein
MHRITRLLTATALSAAVLAPAVPAHAAEVGPCPDGYVGVVVVDASGELARICVRRTEVDGAISLAEAIAGDLANRVTGDVDAYRAWADALVHMQCWWTEGGIVCEMPSPPPPHL